MSAMLMLVLGNNYLVMFVGWEGVGLCSYLLIGFYYDQPVPPAAGKKAFIVNRIGDFAFLLGMFALFANFGSLDLSRRAAADRRQPGWSRRRLRSRAAARQLRGALLLHRRHGQERADPALRLAAGRDGGPDAGLGPDPRRHHGHRRRLHGGALERDLSSWRRGVSLFVAIIGAATAIFAATIALAQTDIKKVLAYSTVSQLGYMFLAAGLGAYSAASSTS